MKLQTLRARIEQELEAMQEVVDQTKKQAERLQRLSDLEAQTFTSAIALNLHSFYTGVERILAEIAKNVDVSTPQGVNWHEALLRQMSTEIPDIRKAVITDQDLQEALDELRRFRHVVRSNYAYKLERDRVLALANRLPQYYQDLEQAFRHFFQSLTD